MNFHQTFYACGQWGSGQCAMVKIYPTSGQIYGGASKRFVCGPVVIIGEKDWGLGRPRVAMHR